MDYSVSSQIKMGNGASINTKGKCHVGIKLKKEQSLFKKFCLCQICGKISQVWIKLVEHGYAIPFGDDECVVRNKGSSGKTV